MCYGHDSWQGTPPDEAMGEQRPEGRKQPTELLGQKQHPQREHRAQLRNPRSPEGLEQSKYWGEKWS